MWFNPLLVPGLVPLEGGLLDLIQGKSADVTTTAVEVGGTIVVIFILIKSIEAKFSIARIIIALLAAGIFLWGITHVNTIKGWFTNEVAAGPQPSLVIHQPVDRPDTGLDDSPR